MLESANLESVNLESANLESVNLESANLESLNLESANLESANLVFGGWDHASSALHAAGNSSGGFYHKGSIIIVIPR